MLQRCVAANGVAFYASPRFEHLGIPHGFSTRIGGISPQPFHSLNLGNPSDAPVKDSQERIDANYQLLQLATGSIKRNRCSVHQVHGATVALVKKDQQWDRMTKADAIVTGDPSRMLAIRVADCVPMLLASMDGKTVAAVHAGWRGVVAEIALAAVDAMNTPPQHIVAAIGPCIGFDSFEVGPEVATQFEQKFSGDAPIKFKSNGKAIVDLRASLRLQLIGAGISPDHIDHSDRCTFRHHDEFFSHRRDNGVTGRMAAVICTAA